MFMVIVENSTLIDLYIYAWFGSFEDVDALEDVSCIERLFLRVISKKFHDAFLGCGRKHTLLI